MMMPPVRGERDAFGSTSPPPKDCKREPRCTVPIAAIFALGCLIIIAAFTAVSTYSGIKFSQNVKGAVDDNLELALRGAIQGIQSPLEESQRYINRLRIKLENEEPGYILDDESPKSLTPQSGFYTDAMLAVSQRPEISSIYQLRRSTRYEHSPGSPVDIVALAIMPAFQLVQFANNTATVISPATTSDLRNISSQPTKSYPLNMSGTPFVETGLATVGMRWVVGVLKAPENPTSTRISLVAQVNGSVSSWAVGIDHNMTVFRDLMKQATAPFSIGITNPSKIVTVGAHTSLYDLNGGVLMSTSDTTVELFKKGRELWPVGSSPNEEINAAYFIAIEACPPSTDACTTNPALLTVDGNLVGAFRIRQAASGLDLLLVSSVPRKPVSIGVAVACCVVIVAGCIAVLVAIGTDLHRLQKNMMLASVLKNNLVEHTPSRLTDIAKLSAVFDEMNQRLLIARCFVPEAVLLGDEEDFEDDNEEDLERSYPADSRNNPSGAHSKKGGSQTSSTVQREQGDRASSSHEHVTTSTGPKDILQKRLFTLSEKRVAALSLNMVGFSGLVGGSDPSRVNDVSSKLLTIVVQAAQHERGVMDSFHGDHFLLTFNASRPVASSLAAAIRTANAVVDEVRCDPRLRKCVGVAAGAAIGKALVGILGIDGHRRLSVIGSVYRQAIALQAVSSQFIQKTTTIQSRHDRNITTMTGCVIEESALREIGECGMYMQLIGRAVPPMGARNQTAKPVYAAHGHRSSNSISNSQMVGDEWLYELDAIHAGDPFTDPNAALDALMSGNTQACNQMLIANDCSPARSFSPTIATPERSGGIVPGDSITVESDVFAGSRDSSIKNVIRVGWGPVETLYRQHMMNTSSHSTTTTAQQENVAVMGLHLMQGSPTVTTTTTSVSEGNHSSSTSPNSAIHHSHTTIQSPQQQQQQLEYPNPQNIWDHLIY